MANHQTLDETFRALADPTRRAVLGRLASGPASVGDLADPFDMALPSFLKHIRCLEETGWIRSRKRGRVRTCTLERAPFAAIETWLDEQQRLWDERTDRLEQFVTAPGPGPADATPAPEPRKDTDR